MHARRTLTGIALIAAGALAMSGCTPGGADADTSSGETIKLTYAFFAPAASFPAVQMQEWADQLNERTDGRVEVELFVGGTLLGSGDIYDGVTQGVVDVGLDSPAYDTSRFPLSSVINVPIGMENAETASKTFLDLLTEFEPEEFDDFEIITAFTTEAAYIQSEDALTNRDDLDGVSLRGSAAVVPVLEALGAAPVGMSMSEVSEAMNTGVIKGYVSSREVMKDFGLAESVKYVTDYPLGISNSFVAVMDKARFDSLPEDVQQVIRDLRVEMMEFASGVHDEAGVQSALDYAKDDFGVETVEVDADDVDAWDEAVNARQAEWVAANESSSFDAQEVLDRALELAADNGE
ncbi:TRAP transporter substrate-binding protein DctP [Microbacterium sp. KRD172]|uniref:TRAP transporter substrate-binding protein DctP n=1 Tax=Microbacterium sp. KRD172 TaxID=2729727 RepID=UPI0019D051B7|nr:TRAP transporter substrate-binding protein DctP [Microbacterium sp. KRD172]